ncbi:hypothetical protein K388_05023 [Streptomyces sp. KhCrAH-43]|uniref:hypothetical protein n=1 Tax=unclassified Streptomyces TaxID=2593676 RepID=UPI000DC602A3|nr:MULTISPECIES: hypothetical protein [unclassified Streptomyces]MYX67294.1 hypothetical protein [Streptomyces sp. SID8373]RAJ54889.1 hypothetical protein K388_05023 [Streptomyces sp. KhCrAH-43]
MTDFDASDIAAMRKEGDLRSFLRDQLRAGQARKSPPPSSPPPKPPDYQAGAWPAGARPPDPPPQHHPPAAWAIALDEYRDWLNTADHTELRNRTDNRQQCGCAACTPRSDT